MEPFQTEMLLKNTMDLNIDPDNVFNAFVKVPISSSNLVIKRCLVYNLKFYHLNEINSDVILRGEIEAILTFMIFDVRFRQKTRHIAKPIYSTKGSPCLKTPIKPNFKVLGQICIFSKNRCVDPQ